LEIIERALSEYGRVVTGELQPKNILNDPVAILELKNRLEIAKLELRLKEQAHFTLVGQQQERIVSLENQLSEVRAILGTQLESVRDLSHTISHLAKSEVIPHTIEKALRELQSVIVLEHSKTNEAILSRTLDTIRVENPGLFGKIRASFSANSSDSFWEGVSWE
jgi:ATP-dependent Lon protease